MLWDRADPRFSEIDTGQRPVALLLDIEGDAGDLVRTAVRANGFDLHVEADCTGLLARIPDLRPDLVCVRSPDAFVPGGLLDRIGAVRTTETLPVLVVDGVHGAARPGVDVIAPGFGFLEAALVMRALLRRYRTTALRSKRRAKGWLLDEARLQLSRDGRTAILNKGDFCLIAPFLDVPDAVLDGDTVQRLAAAATCAEGASRNAVFYLSRTRRSVRRQIGQDPLESVRGQGYRLADGTLA